VSLKEADTRAELIDPALKKAGWGVIEGSYIRREVIAPGRLIGGSRRTKQEIADYVLIHRGQKLAVIEAKQEKLPVTEGLAQAKSYSTRLQTRFAFSTNGHGIYQVDMNTAQEGVIEQWPTPEELWERTFPSPNKWRDRFSQLPRGGKFEPRYYQYNAINQVLNSISQGKDRILVTMATGTGKTAVAFQISWKLFHTRWNLKDWKAPESEEQRRSPRILFLADRNILADQAFNSFSDFEDDALVRIEPSEIRKKNRVPKNGNIFFTIFQTFMSGRDENANSTPYFGDYPEDFFDFIIIDECHRGGAKDESSWRAILEYFSPAVQLGLTATPKRTNNVDTYSYFGDPVYTYSLKEGINDGFLTPFKVQQIATTIDEYVYTEDDEVEEGEIEAGRRYKEDDFNRVIQIKAREEYRVNVFIEMIKHTEKAIVFCATQEHALAIRDLINQKNSSSDPNYCVRVTANDGKSGEQFLRVFQDNEKRIPTILTTSRKLSTGVDARNVRNIILLRPVKSMIEFKQIVGRGTRTFEGKDYFTIYDFVEAYQHFSDPAWDGEPIEPPAPGIPKPRSECSTCSQLPCVCEKPLKVCTKCEEHPCSCEKQRITTIKLSDGKVRKINHMTAAAFYSPDGKPISANQFIERLYGDLPALFQDEDQLRELWSNPETRQRLLQGLEDKGYGLDEFNDIKKVISAEKSDLYDVLAYIAYALPTVTREERVEVRKDLLFQDYSDPQKEFIDFILSHYVDQGIEELNQAKIKSFIDLKYGSIPDAVSSLGSVSEIRDLFFGFQKRLYSKLEESRV